MRFLFTLAAIAALLFASTFATRLRGRTAQDRLQRLAGPVAWEIAIKKKWFEAEGVAVESTTTSPRWTPTSPARSTPCA